MKDIYQVVLGGVNSSFFFELFLGWGWVVGEKKGGIPFFSLFLLSHKWWFIKDIFPRNNFSKTNVIFWRHQTWQDFNTKNLLSKFKEKITKSCFTSNIEYIQPKIEKQFNFNFLCDQKVDVYTYISLYIYWNESEKNGLNNGKTFRAKMLGLNFELK